MAGLVSRKGGTDIVYGYNAPQRLAPDRDRTKYPDYDAQGNPYGSPAYRAPETTAPAPAPTYPSGSGGSGGAGSYDTVGYTPPPSMAALDPTVQTSGYQGGNPGGDAYVSRGAYDQQQQTQLEHDLRMQESKAKTDAFSSLLSRYGGSDSPRVTRTPENQAGEQAARDAAFARAKEKAAQTARASMASLNNVVAERGLMGSSVEAGQTGRIIGGAAGDIGEFLRDQAITESDRAAEISDMDFMAQVSQRGQEMSRKQAMLSLLGNLY